MKTLLMICLAFFMLWQSSSAQTVFTETFDATSTPANWSNTSTRGGPWVFVGTPGFDVSSIVDHTGNSGHFAWMDFSNTDDSVILTTPAIDVSTLTTPYLEFYHESHSATVITPFNLFHVEAWNGTTWVNVTTLQGNTPLGWDAYGYNISAFTYSAGDSVKLRFHAESGGSSSDYRNDLLLDDIKIMEQPSCPAPSALSANNIMTTSVDLGWTENGSAMTWQIEHGSTGFMMGSGTRVATSNNPLSITGLVSNTSYDFYVRSICGLGDTSTWAGPYSFATACNVHGDTPDDAIMINSLPFSDVGTTASCYTNTRNNSSADVFYQLIVAPCTDSLVISLCGSSFDTYLAVYASDTTTQLYNNDDNNDCGSGSDRSEIFISVPNSLTVNGGDTIFIMVEGYSNNQGNFDLSVTSTISCPSTPNLVITEIMYNSPDAGSDSLEFIELYNAGSTTANLSGMTFSQGVTHNFTSGTIPVGGYFVIAGNASAFMNAYGRAADAQWTTGSLSNSGETITLQDATGATVDMVTYDDRAPWPTSPDGRGPSLVFCDTALDNNLPTSWFASTSSIGVMINGNTLMASPGRADSVCSAPATIYGDVSVAAYYIDSTYCNQAAVVGQVVIMNHTAVNANNVMYTITVNGMPLTSDSIAVLAGNSADTISVGPIPANITGVYTITTTAVYTNDTLLTNNTLSMVSSVSNTTTSVMQNTMISCFGDNTATATAVATNGLPAYTYLWSNGDTSAMATNLGAGTYHVTATDNIGCSDTSMIVITEPTQLDVTAVDNGNATATAMGTGGVSPYAFVWSDGQITDTATALTNGTYMVTITDNNGCTDTTSVNVIVVGVQTIANVSTLNMFPNPTSGNVFIQLDLVESAAVSVNVINVTGQTVINRNLGTIQSSQIELTTTSLTTGVYLVKINIGNELVTRKLIISQQ